MAKKKHNPAVNAFAREGGLARARMLTPEERRTIARNAVNARWERYRDEKGMEIVSPSKRALSGPNLRVVSDVEMNLYKEIYRQVRSHTIRATCPCDQCVDTVLTDIRKRYLMLLAKIDNGEKLGKDEGALFKLLIGAKADRWTRVFRRECKIEGASASGLNDFFERFHELYLRAD